MILVLPEWHTQLQSLILTVTVKTYLNLSVFSRNEGYVDSRVSVVGRRGNLSAVNVG